METLASNSKASTQPEGVGEENVKIESSIPMPKGKILIVDDEKNARDALAELLKQEGNETYTASDGRRALSKIQEIDPDVVLTDLKMPGMDGIELMVRARELSPHATFVVMTAFGTVETAVSAIKKGAENYLTKPLDMSSVSALVGRAMEKSKLSREAATLREQVNGRLNLENIIGSHPSMQRLTKIIRQVARSRATALIHGESGTGKELIALAIHYHSKRKEGPFVRLNCAALVETLLESELFGHERGAFTGAVGKRRGRFEEAHGGTLFLDEVSEISLPLQVKLLRFLQERQFERVGGNETIEVDVRVVAATNRDLKTAVKEGRFREDLYYRLNVVQIDVPPLRARRSDIPALAHYFLHKYSDENDAGIEGFSDEALQMLMVYSWPGNVRELENVVERAVVLSEGSIIGVEHLPAVAQSRLNSQDELSSLVPGISMQELERIAIERTLDAVGGSTAKAADILGISRRKIQYRVKDWSSEKES